jgi:hypothetical protein
MTLGFDPIDRNELKVVVFDDIRCHSPLAVRLSVSGKV